MLEDEVYLAAKRFLRASGWRVIAGQPPKGCDSLPVIEIKSPDREGKGSKGALKPDLVAYKLGVIFLVECKPLRSAGDIKKLVDVLDDPLRLDALHLEMRSRGFFRRHSMGEPLAGQRHLCVVAGIAHADQPIQEARVCTIVLSQSETGRLICARDLPASICALLHSDPIT